MREFEYSMEERQQQGDSSNSPPPFMGNISPTMVHVRPSTSSFVDSFGTDQEHDEDREHQKVESRNNGGQGKSTAVPHL
ncbi:unnamed protein product [Anisakis simplex]|uniref:Ovule protein n=1 Tax=Anisakis simplex TaxID=6269 RepID=A0A0M3JEB0_ANISI|nr:unnamed protein product [Anisakis simplex]